MNEPVITIDKLYPNLSETELKVAEENIIAYLGLILRVYTRLEQDESAFAEFKVLTERKPLPRFKAKVDS